jgi:hypothetical protein
MTKLLRPPTHEVPEKFTPVFERRVRSTMKRILELLQKCPGLSFLELVDLAGRGKYSETLVALYNLEKRGLVTSRAVEEPNPYLEDREAPPFMRSPATFKVERFYLQLHEEGLDW